MNTFILRAKGTLTSIGVFLANIDDSFVTAIYGEIASRFQHLQDGPWLLAGYNLGYCAALPVVSHLFSNFRIEEE